MEKKEPVTVLAENWELILRTYNRNDYKPKKTWEALHEDLPDISTSMSFSTFKQYLNVCLIVFRELSRIKKETLTQILRKEEKLKIVTYGLQETKRELDQIIQEKVRLEQELKTVTHKLHKTETEMVALKEELHKVSARAESLQYELDKVIQERDATEVASSKGKEGLRNIDGWSLHKAKDGYYRLHRKIKGRVYSIYLGKEPDVEKAREKTVRKEESLTR